MEREKTHIFPPLYCPASSDQLVVSKAVILVPLLIYQAEQGICSTVWAFFQPSPHCMSLYSGFLFNHLSSQPWDELLKGQDLLSQAT